MYVMLDVSSEFKQADPIKFEKLVTSQGFDNEEELGHLLHKLVRS